MSVLPTATNLNLVKMMKKALLLVQEADILEFNGQAKEAAKVLSKAFELSPVMEDNYNQGTIVD